VLPLPLLLLVLVPLLVLPLLLPLPPHVHPSYLTDALLADQEVLADQGV
jgi:hypothetical protein